MSQVSPREILDAIRKLTYAERRAIIDELMSREFQESPEEIATIKAGLDQAEGGQLINHEDLASYIATRRKEPYRQ